MKRSVLRAGLFAAFALTCVGSVHASEKAIREGQWSFGARAGIAPTVFSEDAKLTDTAVNVTAGSVTVPGGNYSILNNSSYYRDSHKYGWGDSFNLPFTAGGDIGYGVIDNFEVFFNFDYLYAGGDERKLEPVNFLNRQFLLKAKFKDYNSYGFYLGGRYYFDIDSFVSPFVGAKLGALHRSSSHIKATSVTVGDPTIRYFNVPFYKSSTGFSGGLQLGFDYGLTDAFSLVAMAEMLGSTSVKTNKHFNNVYNRPNVLRSYSRVSRGPKGTLSFPMTLGLRARV